MLSNKEMRERIRGREIATIFQDPMESLNPVFTVGGQLQEFIEINRELPPKDARDVAIETLREVDIPKPEDRFDDYPHEFSGGMRQRVLIAMAMACQPSLILADEPTTALDVTVEGQVLNLVSKLQEEYGTSFVWVTHDLAVVADICDRVNVMYLGQIAEQAGVHDLFDDTKHPYTQALLNSVPGPTRLSTRWNPSRGDARSDQSPSGCRFHPRCPEAREVCREINPDPRNVSTAGAVHNAACVKHDVFDVDYANSAPIQTDDDEFGRICR